MNKKPSFFRVDEQVFLTMGILCVVAIIIMAFRVGTRTPCLGVKIVVKSPELTERTLLRFSAETAGGKNFVWNFGDGTPEREEGSPNINHEYKKPGKYTVTVLVNGDCSDIQNILIAEQPAPTELNLKPMIMTGGLRSDTAYVGEAVQFFDNSIGAKEWEWRFGETSDVDNTAQNPVYTFRYAGKKVIALKVNNNMELQDRYSLIVVDRPSKNERQAEPARRAVQPPIIIHQRPEGDPLQVHEDPPKKVEEEKLKAPAVTEAQLVALIRQICAGQKSAADFHQYMCGSTTMRVIYNSSVMSLEEMCQELKEVKEKRIKTLNVIPTNIDNCLNSVNVTLRKKGIFH
jgi:PKD domain